MNEQRTSHVKRLIHAPRPAVYRAFLEPAAVARWMSPPGMRVEVHSFEPRVGGQVRISLRYERPEDAQRGKTSGDTDTYTARFAELVPNEKIVEVIGFESGDAAFAGAMTMTVTLHDAEGGTEVELAYDNLPVGIRTEDNDAGSRMALEKLAALLE